MTVKEVSAALVKALRDKHTNVLSVKPIITAFGPAIAFAKQEAPKYRFIPLRVLIQEGPSRQDCYWVSLESLPDCKETLAALYRRVIANNVIVRRAAL